MRCKHILLTALFTFCLVLPAGAITVEDVIRLAKAHVADEVILNQINSTQSTFVLTTDDILRLRSEGVSDAVIARMIQGPKGGTPAPAGGAPAGEAPAAAAPAPAAAATATLVFENKDVRRYYVQVDPVARSVIYFPGGKDDKSLLGGDETQTFTVPAGTYTVKWMGEVSGRQVAVPGGETLRLVTRPVAFEGYSGVNLTVFSGDKQLSNALLKRNVPARAQEPAPAQGYARSPTAPPANGSSGGSGYGQSSNAPASSSSSPPSSSYSSGGSYAGGYAPAPTSPVYVNYYYPTSPSYMVYTYPDYVYPAYSYSPYSYSCCSPAYLGPYYSYGYRSYPYYGSSYRYGYGYYPYSGFSFGYSHYGRHSSWGFRFGY